MFEVHREQSITGKFRLRRICGVMTLECQIIVHVIARTGETDNAYRTWRTAREEDSQLACVMCHRAA